MVGITSYSVRKWAVPCQHGPRGSVTRTDDSLEASRDVVHANPFGQSVVHVENPGCVEYVTCGLERLGHLGRCAEVEQRRKRQPHVSPLVGDGCTAQTTADLAGQNALGLVQGAVEKPQVIESRAESDVVLVKYRGPLHRRAMQLLARDAVTDFRVHGIGADLISNRPAVAVRPVPDLETRIVGAREKSLEFIHVPVSPVVGEGFNMQAHTCNDECPSTVVSWFTNFSYQEWFHRQCRRRRKPKSSQDETLPHSLRLCEAKVLLDLIWPSGSNPTLEALGGLRPHDLAG